MGMNGRMLIFADSRDGLYIIQKPRLNLLKLNQPLQAEGVHYLYPFPMLVDQTAPQKFSVQSAKQSLEAT